MTKNGGFLSNNPATSRRSCEGGEDTVPSDMLVSSAHRISLIVIIYIWNEPRL